jgi:hypothetical protein
VIGVVLATVEAGRRIIGVDVARGFALFGMMATHTFDTFSADGTPTAATVIAGGRSAATFVLIAGVSLAFMSGGRNVVRGHDRIAVSAGLAVRAVLIGAIGLVLGLAQLDMLNVILPFYALMFLMAIPLLGLRPFVLGLVAVAVIALGPVLLVATADAHLPYAGSSTDPTLGTLVHHPLGLLVQLLVTGSFPVVVYMAYLCVGLAIGRLDLSSRRVAWWLLDGGLALAVTARAVSDVVLYRLGGLAQLIAQGDVDGRTPSAGELLWEPRQGTSWWYLALPSPHANTPVDLVHTLGSAMVVLGAALLLTRVDAIRSLLLAVAAAGAMTLTLYSAHLVVLATGVLDDQRVTLYLLMVGGSLLFAVAWRRRLGQGPLERMVALPAGQARWAVATWLARLPAGTSPAPGGRAGASRPSTIARASPFLVPVAIAGALALAIWGGTRLAADRARASASTTGAEPGSPAITAPAPTVPTGPGEPAGTPDLGLYCRLSQQVDDLETRYPEDPEAVLNAARPQLIDLPRVAPVEIREAVTVVVAGIRADAGESDIPDPDEATLGQATTTVDAFEDENCA